MKRRTWLGRFTQILLKAEVLVAVSILIVSGLIFYASREYPGGGVAEGGGPAFYPRVLAVAWVVLGVVLALGSLRAREERRLFMLEAPRRVLFFLIIMLCFPYLLGLLGFPVASFLCLLLLVSMLRPRGRPLTIRTTIRWILPAILAAGVVTIAIYALFWWGAKVPLPKGQLFSLGILEGHGILI